jgi:hypothetical protein
MVGQVLLEQTKAMQGVFRLEDGEVQKLLEDLAAHFAPDEDF